MISKMKTVRTAAAVIPPTHLIGLIPAERKESIPAIVVITVKNKAHPESRTPIITDSIRFPVFLKYILKLLM